MKACDKEALPDWTFDSETSAFPIQVSICVTLFAQRRERFLCVDFAGPQMWHHIGAGHWLGENPLEVRAGAHLGAGQQRRFVSYTVPALRTERSPNPFVWRVNFGIHSCKPGCFGASSSILVLWAQLSSQRSIRILQICKCFTCRRIYLMLALILRIKTETICCADARHKILRDTKAYARCLTLSQSCYPLRNFDVRANFCVSSFLITTQRSLVTRAESYGQSKK